MRGDGNMSSSYFENLIETVIDSSVSNTWDSAVLEWEIDDVIEDEENDSSCVCGKENIRYLFTIRNIENGSTLFPIGSSCIKKFNRDDLNEITSINETLFKLFHAVKANEFISLNGDFFSRNLLKYLLEEGAFEPNQYNKFNGENDYLFMLDMFNKKKEPSVKQKSKIRAIIVASLKPFLEKQLNDKVVTQNSDADLSKRKIISSSQEETSGYGAGSGDIERYEYECICGKGRIIEEHDNIPGFRDHSIYIYCEDCKNKYDLDISSGVRGWKLKKK